MGKYRIEIDPKAQVELKSYLKTGDKATLKKN